jgi:hypothetical protein
MSDSATIERIFDIMGLSFAERKIILASKMAKRPVAISRATQIPQKSLPYMLSKLEARGLVKRIGEKHKNILWMSDLDRALRELGSLSARLRAAREESLLCGQRARS